MQLTVVSDNSSNTQGLRANIIQSHSEFMQDGVTQIETQSETQGSLSSYLNFDLTVQPTRGAGGEEVPLIPAQGLSDLRKLRGAYLPHFHHPPNPTGVCNLSAPIHPTPHSYHAPGPRTYENPLPSHPSPSA